jgi:energy-coupling factor transporter ATP-binding protein EcfA2
MSRRLREAFTPTRPKQEVNALFVGRLATIRRIISAIEEERANVVLYGDRGRGKTSLANAVEQIAAQAGYLTIKMTCSAELGFEDMFRTLLARVPGDYHRGGASARAALPSGQPPLAAGPGGGSFADRLPEGVYSVTRLAEVMHGITGTHVLMILDEYDRILSEDTRNKLAELIKTLADKGTAVTLFVIGVAESVDHLLGKHPSIQRALVAVHLPPMADREIERIILVGADAAGLGFTADVRRRIVGLSKGLPYYAQLLSLHAARVAAARGVTQVERRDLVEAVRRCVAEAERSLIESYHRTIGPEDGAAREDALYLCAQAEADDFGCFRPQDAARPLQSEGHDPGNAAAAMERTIADLADGCGAVLQREIVPDGHKLRFRNHMMRQFILLMQAERRDLV